MTPRDHLRRWRVFLCVALWALGCSGQTQPRQAHETVTVFVAASTKDAVTRIASAFKDQTQIEVRISAGDSSKLAMQIVQEAPAQLFLSANEKWADYVKEKGFAHETRLLLGDTLVLVTPKGSPVKCGPAAAETIPVLLDLRQRDPNAQVRRVEKLAS